MSAQEHTLRRDAADMLQEAGAVWALRAGEAANTGTPGKRSTTDDALLALLKDDASDAPSFPRRLLPARLLRGVLLRWRLVLAVVALCALGGITLATTLIERRWQGVTTLIVSDRKAAFSVGADQPYQTRDYGLETLMDTLKLPSSLDEAMRRAGVKAPRTRLAAAVKATLAQKSDVVNLRVLWDSPQQAAALANGLADVFVERTTRIRAEQAAEDHRGYQRQLEDARGRLVAIDGEVLAFQQQYKVASFEEETKARLIDLSRLQSEHWASQGEVEALRLARSDFESSLVAVPETVTSTLFRNPLGKRLEDVEWQLKDARTRYTEENPKVVKLREQAAALRTLAANSEFTGGETTRSPNDLRRDLKVKLQDLVTQLHVAEGRESGLANAIAQMEAKIGELAALEKKFRQLEARQLSARELERSLSSKVEESRVAMSAGEPSLQVVERAGIPAEPEPSGRRLVLAASLLVGLMLALGLSVLLELADRRVRCREDIEDHAAGGAPCAEIGRADPAAGESPRPAGPGFRAFRRFVNDLCAGGDEWSTLAVVSPAGGEGRSTVARATALGLAMRGERTILVDADLRTGAGARPGPATGPGFVDVAHDQVPLEECLVRGAHERLRLLPSGAATHDDGGLLLLGQPEATDLLGRVSARCRRTVLDLPPCGEDEGAFELACAARHVVLVARHGVTDRAQLAELVERFEARGVRVAGAIVLDVPPERQHPYAGPPAVDVLRAELQRLVRVVRRSPAHA